MIDFLLGDNVEAQLLRKNFVFKIVPMINVDGVIYGNYRCSLSGIDLNRVWKKPDPSLFPEIVAIKKMIEDFHSERSVVLFTDLHGHSRARKTFMYGNNYIHNPEYTRLFPYIFSKVESELFSYTKCRFSTEKSREGTSRMAIWRLLRIPAVYTLETSLCGSTPESSAPHFSTDDLRQIGKNLCLTVLIHQNVKPDEEALNQDL